MTARPDTPASPGALRTRLDDVMLSDLRQLRRRLDRARSARDPEARDEALRTVEAAVARSEARVRRRRESRPAVSYPPELPVSQRRDDLAEAIAAHQVVIVAGETGSGKTTQLPKICLDLGRGVRGMIGHTQPRRLAARTVADRIASELGTDLGTTVGYAVRFTDRVGDDTLVKLMTDGILLTEIHRDRSLSAYDTIIIDEAHERSLNVDFLLGYLKQLLPRRPDLKVVVTSATIDPERFSRHFDDAPVVEVSGRTYPVEVRYRPLADGPGGEGRDQTQAICDAVAELRAEPPGDILVFLSGEREIRDTEGALRDLGLPATEILPLYARLPTAEQHRVFASHPGRRIVLATNVAETSLTVPGIRYVVDPGTARISRYSHRLKVQRLPIEAVSQASAAQRAGRCGRVAPGICLRLYDEEDFEARPPFTEPEILRTNLASVILQMTAIGLGDIAAFPFLEPPDRRAVADGVRLLQELGALEVRDVADPQQLTPVGRTLARLPVDPRFGRMVIEADRLGCLREVLVIASGLSIEDPRERPSDRAGTADELHARFTDPTSDFLGYLSLWRHLRERQRELSSNQFRKLCRAEMVNHLRVREWQDVHSQLRRVTSELGLRTGGGPPAEADAIHRALLAGLLSHIGVKDRETREFRGARNARFAVFPGSALARRPPQWVMAAELVETSRLWARTVARIQPEWAEELAPHLVKRSWTEPHWSPDQGAAMAYESVSLYGLPIVTRRLVRYGRVDPAHARELFIRHALVEGDWPAATGGTRGHHRFLAHNREVLAQVAELEHRFRRNDLVVDDDALQRLYEERVPADVISGRHFDTWWKKARRDRPDLLTFTTDDLLRGGADDLDEAAFPEWWAQGDLELALTYAFEPGEAIDGVTVHLPLVVLNQVSPDGFDWQVPGFREERVAALIRSLPKHLRRALVPIPEAAREFLADARPGTEPLLVALGRAMSRRADVPIPQSAWQPDTLPPHLSVTFLVVDDEGHGLAEGKDLAELKARLAPRVRATLSVAASDLERDDLRAWSFGELPRRSEHTDGGTTVVGYPALVDQGDRVAIRVLDSSVEQDEATWAGIRRLLLLDLPTGRKALRARLDTGAGLALRANPYLSATALLDDCLTAAVDALMASGGAPVWDGVAYEALRAHVGAGLARRAAAVVDDVAGILIESAAVDRRLATALAGAPALQPAAQDVRAQRASLLPPGFVATLGADRLPDVARYVRAMVVRLESLGRSPARDRERMAQVHRVEAAYGRLVDAAGGGGHDLALERIGWMIEELRVSLFAEQVGTPGPVSEARIERAMAAVRG